VFDDGGDGGVVRGEGGDAGAVAEDGDAVGEGEDFIELV
jgi:hypothetical protein